MLHLLQTLALHLKLLWYVLIWNSESIMEGVFKPLEDPRHIVLVEGVLPPFNWDTAPLVDNPRALLRV